MATTLIRPGIMVALKSTAVGGVTYQRKDLDASGEAVAEGASVARWETIKVVEDPAEHARAESVRSKALKGIRRACNQTSFGLLCPESGEAELDVAIRTARAMVKDYNDGATFTQIHIYAIKGRIASSDAEAARAIGEEVRSLIAGMSGAIDAMNVVDIRANADRANGMLAMLAPEQSATVGYAVDAARKAARQIVKRVQKDGESAAVVLADIQRGAIEKARIAFLDLDDDGPAMTVLPAVNVQRAAELDLDVVECQPTPKGPPMLNGTTYTEDEDGTVTFTDQEGVQ